MFNVGTQELLIILLLVFLLFGPRHIPEVAHTLGKGLGDLRRALQGVEDSVRRAESEVPRLRGTLEEPPKKAAPDPPREREVRVQPAAGSVPSAGTARSATVPATPATEEAGPTTSPPGPPAPPESDRG